MAASETQPRRRRFMRILPDRAPNLSKTIRRKPENTISARM